MSQLRVEELGRIFGGLVALTGVTLTVENGERRAIIGPNGAGKSTLFNLITGELTPSRGRVYFDGYDITRLPVYQRAQLGLSRTFQRNNLFPGLTVLENLQLAVYRRHNLTQHLFKPGINTPDIRQIIDTTLAQVGLDQERNRPVRHLAYGQQRVLEVALALATCPKLLLMDEPTA
ncbi:MAG: ATP-binding cassette domain-containing protein, partial [Chloroflexota bacterium]